MQLIRIYALKHVYNNIEIKLTLKHSKVTRDMQKVLIRNKNRNLKQAIKTKWWVKSRFNSTKPPSVIAA